MSVLVIGHRGARAVAPENTVAGLRRGLTDGADGLEFDVRMLADGHAALMHDATVDRTTNGTGLLASMTTEEVARLDAGARFSLTFRGERVPRLDDVLAEFLGRTTIGLEMKEVLPAETLEAVARAVAACPNASLCLASFQPAAVQRARECVPQLPRALILAAGDALPSAATVHELGLVAIFMNDADVVASAVAGVGALGLTLWVYTVNDPARAEHLVKLGVDGIITDDPATIRARIRAG